MVCRYLNNICQYLNILVQYGPNMGGSPPKFHGTEPTSRGCDPKCRAHSRYSPTKLQSGAHEGSLAKQSGNGWPGFGQNGMVQYATKSIDRKVSAIATGCTVDDVQILRYVLMYVVKVLSPCCLIPTIPNTSNALDDIVGL